MQITASHNPAEYNGLKVSRENALPVGLDTGLGQIKQWIDEGKPTPEAERKGQVFDKDARQDYLAFLRRYMSDLTGLSLAFDLSNGMASLFAKDLFGNAPAYIYDEMDGRFPNHEPNPLVPKNVEALKALVRKTGADVGVIYDGDADRVMFVDENAEFVSPDLMIALLGHYFAGERKEFGTVIQDIRSSKAVGEYLEPMGYKMYTWKVGRANAAHRLREIDGLFGGELAGHYYFKDFFYSDSGLLASILALGVIASFKKKGVPFSKIIAGIARYKNSGEINFRLEDKDGAMDAVRDYFISQETPLKQMDFDGYRVEFKDWWFNIRKSNTEPYLRFICEASSDELLEEKIRITSEILQTKFGATR